MRKRQGAVLWYAELWRGWQLSGMLNGFMVESVGDKGRGLWVDCTDTIGSSLAVFVPESHLVLWGLEVDLVPVEEISVP